MTRHLTHLFLVSSLALLWGCATVFSDSSDTIRIDSEPQGADVYLNSQKIGRTPIRKKIVRDTFETLNVTLSKQGYAEEKFLLEKKLNKTSLINFTFIPSWLTDALSGNMIRYAPNSYQIFLTPESSDQVAILDQRERQKMIFVLNNYHSLLGDIAQGRGEHLEALWKMSSTSQDSSYSDYLSRLTGYTHELIEAKEAHELFAKLNEIFERENEKR